MKLFNRRMTDEAASRMANHGLEHMGFFSPEKEVDIHVAYDYLTRVVMDYDELIVKVEKRSMVKGALLMAGVWYVSNKLTAKKEEEEE